MKQPADWEAAGPNPVWHCQIPSRLSELERVAGQVTTMLEQYQLAGFSYLVLLLLHEFVTNAIIHGNRGDPRKKVNIELMIDSRWIGLRISDEGAGFDWRSRQCGQPPGDTETSGRGLVIGNHYADRMCFNDCGNQVTLWVDRTRKEELSS